MPSTRHPPVVPSHPASNSLQDCGPAERTVVELLAVSGEALGKTRILECLRQMGVRDARGRGLTGVTVGELLASLRERGLVEAPEGSGFVCAPHLAPQALREALDGGRFDALCMAIEEVDPTRRHYGGYLYMRTYGQAVARLRLAMLRGLAPQELLPWLEACHQFSASAESHPYAEAVGRAFDPDLFAHLHPQVQEQAMRFLLLHAVDMPDAAPAIRAHAEGMIADGASDASPLRLALAKHLLLCGRLDQAQQLAAGEIAAPVRAAAACLRGESGAALPLFEAALKLRRKEAGKRNVALPGLPGALHLLALLRSPDPKAGKQADGLLEAARRTLRGADFVVWRQLYPLRQVLAGTMKPEQARSFLDTTSWPLARLFRELVRYWVGLPASREQVAELGDLARQAEAAGFDWIAAQAAALLARRGDDSAAGWGERAAAWRAQHGFGDACDWFAPQEAWQRQLDALIALRQAPATPSAPAEGQVRLAWLIAYEPKWHSLVVEPREQKRDARGQWTRGRPVALKRLREDAAAMPYLTEQDRDAAAAIRQVSNYYGASGYEIDGHRALPALIGHPHLYLREVPDARLEVVRGEPELLVREERGRLMIALQPPVDAQAGAVVIEKETPTRLRVYAISDEHRRIAAIIGRELAVPAHAREQVLKAVGALASSITVQSAIGGAAEAEAVDAERRLFAHLLPHEGGLRVQLAVQPFGAAGPAYAPGHGSDNVIAEVGGRRVQARRDLAGERAAARALVAACPALADASEEHGERLLPEPAAALDMLMQLKAQADGGSIVLAWPQGEKFRIVGSAGFAQLRLAIKGERDWFAAGGELRIDEDTVLDLRRLLELVQGGAGRFIALDDQRFVALTEEFHRRLRELAALADTGAHGARVHALAAASLEDFAEMTGREGTLKADKKWKEHLARLAGLDAYAPQLPATLQAELRDYQLEGFRWLARLAHWGVGACLADDMGLGKTVQALALLLLRAPAGPALVVAPTSVCTNWLAEIARFAPTLNARLFGGGDRGDMLARLQGFDVVVVSYGLLQQESALFAGVRWHTVVLDEAQAVKNAATKRSQAVMALQGDFRLAVTGTPLENHLGELWNLFRFLNPGLLGSLEQFNVRFAAPIEKERDAEARARLRRLIQPFMLRRTKTQVLAELPTRTEIVRDVELSKEEAALYESLRRSALERLSESEAPAGQQALQILAEIMKLRRACCHPSLVAPELGLAGSKLAAFGELVEELLANRHKALVFSQFVDHLAILRGWLDQRGIRYQYLDGATTMAERKKRVDAFQGGDGDIFLISLKAGGTGLNLTAADYVIHMDPWWNPAVEDQASDRAHRMGQQRPVTIYRLVARGTIEEQIVDLHRHKRDLADSLLAGGEAAAKMSAQQMLELLRQG
ncbi:MAG TPA: SNF2-related protein [Noviherbaspirillum sp.]|nr:SNF2-related protein [Noviherbaspirillum sp.]